MKVDQEIIASAIDDLSREKEVFLEEVDEGGGSGEGEGRNVAVYLAYLAEKGIPRVERG